MMNFFSNMFGYILNAIYMLVQNYGLAIIIFSVLVKILMMPLSIKQQKSMKKNEKIQKEVKIIQLKHKDNPEMVQQEVMQLYKRENMNPMSGCFSIIIQMILLISMFYLVRSPLTFMRKTDKYVISQVQEYVQKENGQEKVTPLNAENIILRYVANNKDKVIEIPKENGNEEEKVEIKLSDLYLNMEFAGLDLSQIPQENKGDLKLFIIPALYVISSFISIKLTSTMTHKKMEDKGPDSKELINEKDMSDMSQQEMSEQMNKTMSWLMPFLAVSISIVTPLGLALYWLVNNIIMIFERLLLNKFISEEDNENA